MRKEKENLKLPIPATLIAHVHDTTANGVRTARCRWTPKTDEYNQTEQEIQEAIAEIKKNKSDQ